MAVFDWYQATIPQPVDDVLEALSDLSDGLRISHSKGMHGYGATAVLGSPEHGQVARVMHGGTHAYPHAVISGEWAQRGSGIIRASFPEHTVTRADVADDFTEEGAFDAIQTKALETAKVHRVKVGTAGDHLLTMEGRTLYLGSPSSSVRARLYDKRAEVMSQLPAFGIERQLAWARIGVNVPDDWTRLELQIRPQTRESRTQFASIAPEEALGATAWSRALYGAVMGLSLEPVQVGKGYRVADDERTYAYMLRQYRSMLRRRAEGMGKDEMFAGLAKDLGL